MHRHNCHFGRRISKRFTLYSSVFAMGFALTATVSSYAFVRLANGSAGLFWPQGGRNSIAFTISTNLRPPTVPDGSSDSAIRLAFDRWQSVSTTGISFQEDQRPDQRGRNDWQSQDLHLVWFDRDDSSGMFAANSSLVAVTPVTFAADGSILDADMIFNAKDHTFSTTQKSGTFDVQNIATHECGHFLGLDHSAILGATMNPFAIQQDVRLRSLERDDAAGTSTIYPRSGFALGSITGKVVNSGGSGISGAHVVAEDASGVPAASGLTGADGSFAVQGLSQGSYTVYVEPLDGAVVGNNLSLATSGLRIDTNFGTTFHGTAANPTRVNVNTSPVSIGTLTARANPRIVIQGANPNAVLAGDSVTINAFGSGFDSKDTAVISGDGFSVTKQTITSTSISLTVKLDAFIPPCLRSIKLVRTNGDARVLTGGIEVRSVAPALSGISPASAQAGATITLKGANLRTGGVIVLGDRMVTNPSATGDTVTFALPGLAAGKYDVSFQNDDGQQASLAAALTVEASATPPADPTSPTATASGGAAGSGSSPSTPTTQQSQNTATPSQPTVASRGNTGFFTGGSTGGGGGGGGGGGCALDGGRDTDPTAVLPLAMLALVAIVVRRRG